MKGSLSCFIVMNCKKQTKRQSRVKSQLHGKNLFASPPAGFKLGPVIHWASLTDTSPLILRHLDNWYKYVFLFMKENKNVTLLAHLSKTAQMTDGPTLTNDSWKLGYGGSKKYEYTWYNMVLRLQMEVWSHWLTPILLHPAFRYDHDHRLAMQWMTY